jgi:hypothetical protein
MDAFYGVSGMQTGAACTGHGDDIEAATRAFYGIDQPPTKCNLYF